MKKFVDVSEEIKDYISPKKYFVKKKACNKCLIITCVIIAAAIIGGAIFAALKYKRDYDFFDDYDDDFGLDDALYAKESDFDE